MQTRHGSRTYPSAQHWLHHPTIYQADFSVLWGTVDPPLRHSPLTDERLRHSELLYPMNFSKDELPPDLIALADSIEAAATARQGECLELLQLLRVLEEQHRDIHDGLFKQALPDNRQALYALLQDIENSGSWPYISRMQVRSLLQNLSATALNPGLEPPVLSEEGEAK